MSGEPDSTRPPLLLRFAVGALAKGFDEFRTWTEQTRDDLSRLPDEIKRIPSSMIAIPVQVVTDAVAKGLRVQQNFNALVSRGDETLDQFFNKPVDQPSWATFDEDDSDQVTPDAVVTPLPSVAEREKKTRAPRTSPSSPQSSESKKSTRSPASDSTASPASSSPSARPRKKVPAPSRTTAKPVTSKPATSKPATAKSLSTKPTTTKPTTAKPTTSSPKNIRNLADKKIPPLPSEGAPITEVVTALKYKSLTLAQLGPATIELSTDKLQELLHFERSHGNRPPFITLLENRISSAGS